MAGAPRVSDIYTYQQRKKGLMLSTERIAAMDKRPAGIRIAVYNCAATEILSIKSKSPFYYKRSRILQSRCRIATAAVKPRQTLAASAPRIQMGDGARPNYLWGGGKKASNDTRRLRKGKLGGNRILKIQGRLAKNKSPPSMPRFRPWRLPRGKLVSPQIPLRAPYTISVSVFAT